MKNNIEVFLKYLINIYQENSSLPITSDTIYNELRTTIIEEDKVVKVPKESLLAVQVKLNNKYKNNKILDTYSNGYYLVIENRSSLNDKEFYNKLKEGYKLYIPVTSKKIYTTSYKIIDFILKENILVQCKIAKNIGQDALLLRVTTKEDVTKIIDYLNTTIKYTKPCFINPFVYINNNIGIVVEGDLSTSYNHILAVLLSKYLISHKDIIPNDIISSLIDYINKNILNSINKEKNIITYNIKSEREYSDFLIVVKLLIKYLDNTITIEDIYNYQDIKAKHIEDTNIITNTEQDKDKVLYVINKLTYHYSLEEVHQRILYYLDNKDINIFTRKDNIRQIIKENFSPEKLKLIISNIGLNALISAAYETNKKYERQQVLYGVTKLIENKDIAGFTNDNDTRSYLGLVIPIDLLLEVLKNKTQELNIELTPDNITNYLLEEIQKKKQTI